MTWNVELTKAQQNLIRFTDRTPATEMILYDELVKTGKEQIASDDFRFTLKRKISGMYDPLYNKEWYPAIIGSTINNLVSKGVMIRSPFIEGHYSLTKNAQKHMEHYFDKDLMKQIVEVGNLFDNQHETCLLYTSPSPRD